MGGHLGGFESGVGLLRQDGILSFLLG